MSQSQENVPQMEGGTYRPYFIGPFRARLGYNNLFSASDWWEYTKSFFKVNSKIFSKNSNNSRKYYNFKTKIRQIGKFIQKRKLKTRN